MRARRSAAAAPAAHWTRAASTRRRFGASFRAMKMSVALALCLLTAPTAAQETPLDGAGWRAYAEGWTLHFEEDGAPYGAESYHPGDAVIWKPEGGACAQGFWIERRGALCFLYQDGQSCWRMSRDADGVLARPADGGGPALRVVRRDRAPLLCPETPSV